MKINKREIQCLFDVTLEARVLIRKRERLVSSRKTFSEGRRERKGFRERKKVEEKDDCVSQDMFGFFLR